MASSPRTPRTASFLEPHHAFKRTLLQTYEQVNMLQDACATMLQQHELVISRLLANIGPVDLDKGFGMSTEMDGLLVPQSLHGSVTAQVAPWLRAGSPHAQSTEPLGFMDGQEDLAREIVDPAASLLSRLRSTTSSTEEPPPTRKSQTRAASNKSPKRRPSREHALFVMGQGTLGKSGTGSWDKDDLVSHPIFHSLEDMRTLERTSAMQFEGFSEMPTAETRKASMWTKMQAFHPHSRLMSLWEGLGTLALLIDCIAVPWFFSFYTQTPKIDAVLYCATFEPRIYWTLDIFVTAVKGYWTSEIHLERRIRKTFGMYLRSWLLCDIVLVAVGWLFQRTAQPKHSPKAAEAAFARSSTWDAEPTSLLFSVLLFGIACNLLRHARRVATAWENTKVYMLMWQGNNRGMLVLNIMSIVMIILLINHFISCLWYSIGGVDTDTGLTWLGDGWREQWPSLFFYSTSLHWALSQMTPGSMEVVPRSTIERVYNVLVLLAGWVVATTLTGLVNAVMTGARLRFEEKSRRFLVLQRFLLQEGVEHSLAMTVNMQVKARRQRQPRIRLHDVEDMVYLSKATRQELSTFIYGRQLRANAFFRLLETMNADAFGMVCSQAIWSSSAMAGDSVFDEGSSGESIIFLHHGVLQYAPGKRALEAQWAKTDPRLMLHHYSWCSEASLWSEWTYLGTLQALEKSEIFSLSATALCKQIRKYRDCGQITAEFSRAFVWRQSTTWMEWSDLTIQHEHADIIAAMSRSARILLGEVLLDPMQKAGEAWGWFASDSSLAKLARLQNEISNGECFVCLHGDEVVRTVFLVTLLVRRASDVRLLAKIGELPAGDSAVKAGCMLPGTKRKEEETAHMAIKRLVTQEMHPASEFMQIDYDHYETLESMQKSASYGIRTCYAKTHYTARVDSTALFPRITVPGRRGNQKPVVTGKSPRLLRSGSTVLKHLSTGSRHSGSNGSSSMSLTLTSSQLERSIDDYLQSISDVIVLPNKRSGLDVFIWTSDAEFDLLCSPEAKEVLEEFLATLPRSEEALREGASEWHAAC